MRDDHFLDDGEAEAGAGWLGRGERLKETVKRRALQAGAVVIHRHVDVAVGHFAGHHNAGRDPAGRARFQAVPNQVAEGLPQQHVITVDRAELAEHRHGVAGQVFGGADDHRAQIDRRHHERFGPCEPEEVGHHFAERCRLRADALDVGAMRLLQGGGIEQAPVPVDGRKPVAELMRETGRELAQPRQRLFEAQLFFELDHRSEIGKQADRRL